jgi:hypothetical protein
MTAIPQRRTRRTIIGMALAVMLSVAALGMFGVGVVTLSNSQEGEAVGVDDRPRIQLPETPNALLALTDEGGQLASLVLLTLLPEGQGGSIVSLPVNADASAGFGDERQPLNELFDAADIAEFATTIEDMLSITVQRSEVVDAAALQALLPEIEALQLVIPNDVVDTRGGGGVIASSGPQTFTMAELLTILAAIDDEADGDVSHANDVAVWSSLAQLAPVTVPPEPLPRDALGSVIAPTTVGELVARMWQGTVSVRDLVVFEVVDAENPTQVDVVLIDRRDSTLVFAQVSPGLVSTPNAGLKARIVVNFTAEELATADGLYDSTSDVAVELIGRLLFLSGNIVSVETAATGAPAVTIIEVASESQLDETIEAAKALVGDAEVRVSETLVDGVDTQVTLGMSYLQHEVARVSGAGAGTVAGDG